MHSCGRVDDLHALFRLFSLFPLFGAFLALPPHLIGKAPKGTDFSTVSDEELLEAQLEMNNRPRKCLGYLSPKEALEKALLHLT